MFQFGLVWFGMMLSLAAVLGQVKQFKASIIIKNVILKSSPHSLPVDGIWQVGLWVTVQSPICMAGVFSSGNWFARRTHIVYGANGADAHSVG